MFLMALVVRRAANDHAAKLKIAAVLQCVSWPPGLYKLCAQKTHRECTLKATCLPPAVTSPNLPQQAQDNQPRIGL